MNELKKNKQDGKGKLERSKLTQTHPSQITLKELAQTRPCEITPEKLRFFLSNSPKREVS